MRKRIALLGLLMTTAFLSAAPGFDFSGRKVPFEITYILPKATPGPCDGMTGNDKICCLSWQPPVSPDHSACHTATCTNPDPVIHACCVASSDPAATPDTIKAACPSTTTTAGGGTTSSGGRTTSGGTTGGGTPPGAVTDQMVVECHCDNPKDEAHECSKDGIPCCFSTTTDPSTKKSIPTPFTCEVREASDSSSDGSTTKSMLVSKSIATIGWQQVDGIRNVETGAPLTGVTALSKTSTVPDLSYHGTLQSPSTASGERIGLVATAGGSASQPGYILSSFGVQGGGCGCNINAADDPTRTRENLRDLILVFGAVSLLWYASRRRLMPVRRGRRVAHLTDPGHG